MLNTQSVRDFLARILNIILEVIISFKIRLGRCQQTYNYPTTAKLYNYGTCIPNSKLYRSFLMYKNFQDSCYGSYQGSNLDI